MKKILLFILILAYFGANGQITTNSNFKVNSSAPLFDGDTLSTLADTLTKQFPHAWHEVTVVDVDQKWRYNPSLGHWERILSSGTTNQVFSLSAMSDTSTITTEIEGDLVIVGTSSFAIRGPSYWQAYNLTQGANGVVYFDFIVTGQSNVVNRDNTVGDWTYEIDSMILVLQEDTRLFEVANPALNNIDPGDSQTVSEFERNNIGFAFARNFRKYFPDITVRFFSSSDGGENSDQWLSGAFMWDSLTIKLDNAPADFKPGLILVHQGEADDADNTESEFLNNWFEVYDSLAARSDVADIPKMIFADFARSDFNEYLTISYSIDSIQNELRDFGGRDMVAARYFINLTSQTTGDDVHFTNETIDFVGRKYFEAFMSGNKEYTLTGYVDRLFLGQDAPIGQGRIILPDVSTLEGGGINLGNVVGIHSPGNDQIIFHKYPGTSRSITFDFNTGGPDITYSGSTANAGRHLWDGGNNQLSFQTADQAVFFYRAVDDDQGLFHVSKNSSGASGDFIFASYNTADTLFRVTHEGNIFLGSGVGKSVKSDVSGGGILDVQTGYRLNGSATLGEYLRGNGTNFVSSAVLAADVDITDSGGHYTGTELETALGEIGDDLTAVENKQVVQTGSGAPGTTPNFVGEFYIDTTGPTVYFAAGTGSSADWVALN